jgi:hypothetical protein
MSSTDLDTLGVSSAELEALRQQQQEDMENELLFQTPILKLCQSLTNEVQSGDAEEGEFFNTLTGESYGNQVDFIVAYYQRGRAMSLKDGRYFVSIAEDLIPESWADAVGEEFVGTRFDEHPDAEEQYRARVQRKEHEWGSGPPISTTFNYTGLVIPSADAVGEENQEDVEPLPVRLTFARITKDAHTKIQSLKKATSLRNKDFWAVVFTLTTEVKSYGRFNPYIVKVKKGRDTTPDEQQQALQLALAVAGGRVQSNEEASAEDRPGPRVDADDDNGGLGI